MESRIRKIPAITRFKHRILVTAQSVILCFASRNTGGTPLYVEYYESRLIFNSSAQTCVEQITLYYTSWYCLNRFVNNVEEAFDSDLNYNVRVECRTKASLVMTEPPTCGI